jgi:basic membrane protein A
MKKFVFVLFLVLVISLTFASTLKVAIVIAGELGDKSFYDSSNLGLQKAIKDFGIVGKILPCKTDPANYMPQMVNAASNFKLVIVVGYELIDTLQQIAPEFKNTDFVYIDDVVNLSEVTSIVFKQNESSFMGGALAAMFIDKNNLPKYVGFVGGEDYSVIRDFLIGYTQGVHYVDPKIKVISGYVGGWDDPATAKQIALNQYNQGAHIIFQVAGGSGLGVIEAAKDNNFYAIGVDSPQGYLAPKHVLTSVVKHVDTAVYDMIKDELNGTFKRGRIYYYGISNNGVGLSYSKEMLTNVPADIVQKLISLRTDIITSKIKVKSYFDKK